MWAIGNRHQYNDIDLNFTVTGSSNIVLSVHDMRTEVLTTNKSMDFVGYMRSGVGIPYNIGTKSKRPLADDIADDIAKGLGKRGFKVTVVAAPPSETHEQLVMRLKALNAGMPVVLHLTTWHSDSYQAVWYNFNVVLQVYDAEGKFLGQKVLEGKEHVGTTMWNPVKLAKKNMPVAFKKKMEELFNSPEIVAVLK
jgi:hypothetical protein